MNFYYVIGVIEQRKGERRQRYTKKVLNFWDNKFFIVPKTGIKALFYRNDIL